MSLENIALRLSGYSFALTLQFTILDTYQRVKNTTF